jgi:RsiW-degrading membrane proteinase PrsW (M82 family)
MRIVLIAALLPCVVVGYYIFKKDSVESEPSGLLLKLFFLGCFSTIPAIALESVGMRILAGTGLTGTALILAENFLVVGLAEELCKRFMLHLGSWKDPAFNYLFDGVVYGVFVALGFAGLENIGYIMGFGLEVAPIRGLAAIPLHAICGMFMGHFYGLEKAYTRYGYPSKARSSAFMSLLIPVLIHGFYDFAASMEEDVYFYVWIGFVIVMDIIAVTMVKKYAQNDQAL